MLDEMCASWGIVGNEIQALLHSHGHWSMNLINKHTFADSYFESFSLVLCFTLKVLQWRLSALLWLAVGVLLLFNFCLLFIYLFFFSSQIVGSGRLVVSTRCGHVFCSQCLRDSLTSSHTCPTCRKRLTHRQYHPLYIWHHSETTAESCCHWTTGHDVDVICCWIVFFFFFLFCVCASVWTLKCWVIAGKHGLMIHVCWFVC